MISTLCNGGSRIVFILKLITPVSKLGQQNYMFVSLHIPKKSNKTRSEPINIYIYKNHGGSHGHKI
jgi:hypothetical protein